MRSGGVHPTDARVKMRGERAMGRLLRYLLVLVVLAAVIGVVYAMVADLPPPLRSIEREIPGAALR